MKNHFFFILLFSFILPFFGMSQNALQQISVQNYNGKILISWKNSYKQSIANINIQRSYDSLKNYSTIGTVLNTQIEENGYADNKPPYNKMYYKLFIAFEGGSYTFSNVARPVKLQVEKLDKDSLVFIYKKYEDHNKSVDRDKGYTKENIPKEEVITYPSKRIFTIKTSTVAIKLPDAIEKKYTIKFYTEENEFLFEITKVNSSTLYIDKSNFDKSGWYYFEIYESGKLIEKNKFNVPKDTKAAAK